MDVKLIVFLVLFSVIQTDTLDCKDENNNNVDWFVAYKIPKVQKHGDTIQKGLGYVYLTADDPGSWKLSNLSIGDTSSIIGNTLREFYSHRSNLSYVLYNDEPPNHNTSTSKGHTKGVVATDAKGGFWLVHSVPKFPQLEKNYSYPETGVKYGQTFLCISMNLTNVNKVGLQLQYNQPNIFLENIKSNMNSSVPDLAKAAANVTIKTAPWNHVAPIFSKNNTKFLSFAKSKKFAQELYEDFVAPYLKNDLDVETWPNGGGRLRSNCSGEYKVNNIKGVNMTVANLTFTTTSDHSKWAVSSTTSGRRWTCIGDINRSQHQLVRGGGTVCLNNLKLSRNFQKLIGSVEECSSFDDLDYLDLPESPEYLDLPESPVVVNV